MSNNKHIFALHIQESLLHTSVTITDRDILLRVQQVLRLQVDDTLLVFNSTHHARARIRVCDKRNLVLTVHTVQENKQLYPLTHWLLPVLEREAFEASLYSLAVLGATTIQPLITEKSRRQWGSEKDLERAERIMIAACEQAKQFVLPAIKPATHLPVILSECQARVEGQAIKKIFFDPTGAPAAQLMQDIKGADELILCIGPEGDLTEEEKQLLKDTGFSFYALTSTVLRACDAVLVAQGIIRSFCP